MEVGSAVISDNGWQTRSLPAHLITFQSGLTNEPGNYRAKCSDNPATSGSALEPVYLR